MIDFTPISIVLAVGRLEIRWFGIAYVTAIVAGTWLAFSLHRAPPTPKREDVLPGFRDSIERQRGAVGFL
jgi:prolipoprotein diacylglyceryltransferase